MENELINKLDNDIDCELSNEEIKMLYEIDYCSEYDLSEYRNYRDQYADLSKIFDKDVIATKPEEVDENTIVYIGNIALNPNDRLNAFNLKYIIGNIRITYGANYSLENLEKCMGLTILVDFDNYYSSNLDSLNDSLIIDQNVKKIFKISDYEPIEIQKEDFFKHKSLLLDYFYLFPNDLKGDREVAFEAVKNDPISLAFVLKELKEDKTFVFEAVKQNGFALEFVIDKFKNDKDIVLEAIKTDGYTLMNASNEIKADKDIVLKAVRQNGEALLVASNKLWNDFDLINASAECYVNSGDDLNSLYEVFTSDEEKNLLDNIARAIESIKGAKLKK